VATAAETGFNAPTSPPVLIDETVGGTTTTTADHIADRDHARRRRDGLHCQLYKKVGSTYTLIASVVMATGTPSGSVANQTADFGYSDDNPLVLGSGVGLAVAIGQSIANGVVFRASGGGF